MEFLFDINRLFGSDISLVDRNLTPARNYGGESLRQAQDQIKEVLDRMGERSAKAQGLYGPITSGHRLQLSDHRLYLLKHAESPNGRGEVVGFIKVGRKRLFVYDPSGVQQELEPMCVLDFYVHESRQRHGYGRRLFDHMMQCEGIERPDHLAIDKPSHKFVSFLKKHFNLSNNVPQLNNFVVFSGFFRSRPASESVLRHRRGRPPVHPTSRASSANSQKRPTLDTIVGRGTNYPSTPCKELSAAEHIQQQHSVTSLQLNGRPSSREKQTSPLLSGRRTTRSPQAPFSGRKTSLFSRHQADKLFDVNPKRDDTDPPLRSRDGPREKSLEQILRAAEPSTSEQKTNRQQENRQTSRNRMQQSNELAAPAQKREDTQDAWNVGKSPLVLQRDTSWNVLGIPSHFSRNQFSDRVSHQRQQQSKFWWQ